MGDTSQILSGEQVIATVREQTDTILLAFSCGKDSIGAWLECRRHFRRIVPFYMYTVPGLEFVERALAYYEDWFGERIYRVPHPSLYRMLNALVFQPPERCEAIESMGFIEIDYTYWHGELRSQLGLGPECYTASGVRAVDSPQRMIAMKRHGAINHKKRQFFPVWDWRKDRLLTEIRDAGVKLPPDYRMFGRSFDGVDYRFLAPIKEHYPRDYARILDWFPLADAEIERRRYVGAA